MSCGNNEQDVPLSPDCRLMHAFLGRREVGLKGIQRKNRVVGYDVYPSNSYILQGSNLNFAFLCSEATLGMCIGVSLPFTLAV